MSKIKKITARQIIDSRGNPTVEVDITTSFGVSSASVPSGASTGKREALELRDNSRDYMGKSVFNAIDNIRNRIAPELILKDCTKQKQLDQIMIDIDATEYKSSLGANAILPVSMAIARAGAVASNKPLYQYLNQDIIGDNSPYVMPMPLINVINGGAHANNNLDIQEFMIVPHIKDDFLKNIQASIEVFHNLKQILIDNDHQVSVGDEGGFAPLLASNEVALDYLIEAIEKAGYRPGEDISLSLDVAASELCLDGTYKMQDKNLSSCEMIDYFKELILKYPIYSVEDALDENDHASWKVLTSKLKKDVLLVGDDLFVTNKKILKEGIENGEANSILIKINQIGTISETIETLKLARDFNYKSIISHRSGETADSFISDLAVACTCGHIKTGSVSRTDRTEKYNQLIRIYEQTLAPYYNIG